MWENLYYTLYNKSTKQLQKVSKVVTCSSDQNSLEVTLERQTNNNQKLTGSSSIFIPEHSNGSQSIDLSSCQFGQKNQQPDSLTCGTNGSQKTIKLQHFEFE